MILTNNTIRFCEYYLESNKALSLLADLLMGEYTLTLKAS